jgi:hypothetical protein
MHNFLLDNYRKILYTTYWVRADLRCNINKDLSLNFKGDSVCPILRFSKGVRFWLIAGRLVNLPIHSRQSLNNIDSTIF